MKMSSRWNPSNIYLLAIWRRYYKKKNIIFVVARYEGEIVGGLTAHELPSTYFEANEVYIYDLAVGQDFQRKGIGTRLIEELKKISCSKGDKEIFLQADVGDDYAIDFYKKIGGVPEDVIHFSFACDMKRKNSLFKGNIIILLSTFDYFSHKFIYERK